MKATIVEAPKVKAEDCPDFVLLLEDGGYDDPVDEVIAEARAKGIAKICKSPGLPDELFWIAFANEPDWHEAWSEKGLRSVLAQPFHLWPMECSD